MTMHSTAQHATRAPVAFGLICLAVAFGNHFGPQIPFVSWIALGLGLLAIAGAASMDRASRSALAVNADSLVFSVRSPVVIRSYSGRSQPDAAALFQREATYAASLSYLPVSQSWADGRPGAGRILALGSYAAVARPNGALTVTYRLQDA